MRDTFLIKIRVCSNGVVVVTWLICCTLRVSLVTHDICRKECFFFQLEKRILWFTDEVIEEILQMKLWRVLDNRYTCLTDCEWRVHFHVLYNFVYTIK